MNRPFRALWMEQWRQTWIFVAIGLLFMLGLRYWCRSMFISDLDLVVMFGWVGILCLFSGLFVSTTARDLRMDFPKRLFALPISSNTLFFAQWSYKIVIGVFFGVLWSLLDLNYVDTSQPWWMAPLFFAVLISYGQMGACLVSALGILHGLLLSAIPIVVAVLGLEQLLDSSFMTSSFSERTGALLLVTFLVSTLLGRMVTAKARSGSLKLFEFRFSRPRTGTRELRPRTFASRDAAQRWFEWRHSARYGLAVSIALLLLGFALNLIFSEASLGIVAMSLLAIAFGAGFYLTYATPRYAGFSFTKPAADASFGRSKVAAGLRYSVMTTAVLFLVLIGPVFTDRSLTWFFLFVGINLFVALMVGRETLLGFLLLGVLSLPPQFFQELESSLLISNMISGGHSAHEVVKAIHGRYALLFVLQDGAYLLLVLSAILWWSRKSSWGCAAHLPYLIGAGVIVFAAELGICSVGNQRELMEQIALQIAAAVAVSSLFAEARSRDLIRRNLITQPLCIFLTVVISLATLKQLALTDEFNYGMTAVAGYVLVIPGLAALAWVPLFTQWQRHR